jgi:molecular chaperone IbpA
MDHIKFNLLKKEKKMTVGRISFGPLYNSTLGFDRFFTEVEKLLDSDLKPQTATAFPPHNIMKVDESHYVVELAIAGFSKDEIDITLQEGNLVIKGSKQEKTDVTYLHRGIGTRSFTKTLTLADTIEVRGAEFVDGILRVVLENVIPESKKPQKIEIGLDLKTFKPELLTEEKKVA